jgi:hypothetical protein
MSSRALSYALKRLKEQGLDLPSAPENEAPPVPEDVTSLPDNDLMNIYAEFTAWLVYAQTALSIAEVKEKEADVALERIKAEETLRGLSTDERITVASKVGVSSEAFQDAEREHLECVAHRKMLTAVVLGFDKSITLLSREVTRRVSRHTHEERMHRWGGA